MLGHGVRSLFFLLSLLSASSGYAQGSDSVRVEQLLRGARSVERQQLMLHFGRQLAGVPYVAHTLKHDVAEPQLVVDLRQMDCTTFVETCVALTLTAQQGSECYADYCHNLTRIRYAGGQRDGYASRNHYFHQWIRSNEAQRLVEEITCAEAPFTAVQHLKLNYMSAHASRYPALADTLTRQHIVQAEQAASGEHVQYIPREQLVGDQHGPLGVVRDGDILAIVTRKAGLDTSHLGIAVWGKDHRLHLLNASQVRGCVVEEPMTLHEYMTKHPSQLGVRVIRVN